MKKRLLAALMAGAMALSMTACGGSSSGSDDSNAASGGDSAKAGSYKVGVVQLVQHVALDAATRGFQDKLTELVEADGGKVEFDVQNASGESANCSTIVNGFVSAGDDLIMANATAALPGCAGRYHLIFRSSAPRSPTTAPRWASPTGPARPAPTSPAPPTSLRSTVRLTCSRSCSRMRRT